MKMGKIKLYGGLIIAMCFWAFSFIWYKHAYRHLEPMALVFFRLVTASVFLSLVIALTGKFERIQKKDKRLFLLLVTVEPLLYFLGESYGMTMVSATIGSIIVSFIPLLTPIVAFFLFRKRLSWYNYAGISLSFAGVLMVLIGKNFTLNAPILGVALMFLAVIAAVSYSVIIVYLANNYRPITIIWIQSVMGSIIFLPLFIIFDLEETLSISWSWEVIAPIIKLGIFPSAISFILYTRAIREIGITMANTFTNFVPVFVAILSFFILKEEMPAAKIIGIIVVLAGLWLSQRKKKLPIKGVH